MHKSFLFTILILFIYQINNAQSLTLVEDYIDGEVGSIEGRVFQFQNTLTYEGIDEFGEPVILQYDKITDQVSILARNEDFDGEVTSVSTNTLEMTVFTTDGLGSTGRRNIYRAYESDFSDIQKIYNSGDADIWTFRFHEGHYMIIEYYTDQNGDEKVNFRIVNPDGDVDDFLLGLSGSPFDFSYTAIDGHFIVAPELDYIDGKSVLAYSIEEKSEVPITNIIPGFQDCGVLSRMGAINNNIIFYNCESTNIYDLGREEFLNTQNLSYSIIHDKSEILYVTFDGGIYKFFKSTGQLELVADDYITFRPDGYSLIFASLGSNGADISMLNFENDELYTFATDIPTDVNLRFTGFGSVPEGVHLTIYESTEDNGIIANINKEAFTVIDSVYNVNFLNRPVAYGEDVYYTHQDPAVGNELFMIDYEISSLNEIANEEIISVSPNPVINNLQINHKSDAKLNSVQIIDQSGRIVKTASDQSLINVSQLNSGLYFLKAVYEGGKNGVTRFVKN